MDENGMAKGLVVGLLAGAVLGLAVGMLYAPKSGEDTREMLKEKALEARDKAGEMVDKAKNELKLCAAAKKAPDPGGVFWARV
jgi:gas vesicle protein